jgi:hypothetical protein
MELYLYLPLYTIMAFTDSFTFTFMDKETWKIKQGYLTQNVKGQEMSKEILNCEVRAGVTLYVPNQ